MKNLIILSITLFFASCNAQTINLEDQGSYRHYPQGAYFKDITNYLDPFTGTYLYTDGNISLKIILGKKIKDNGRYSEDVIYGGYEYKVNGITLANTLPETLPLNTYAGSYFINGNSFLLNDSHPPCNTCAPNEKRLYISIMDTQCSYYRNLVIKKEIVAGVEQIKITIQPRTTVYYKSTEPEPTISYILPDGDYTLIKQ